jgi:hypothetical protein
MQVFQFDIAAGSKGELYRDLIAAIDAVTADEKDSVANMANVAALLWEHLPDLNWAGFYRVVDGGLILGPLPASASRLVRAYAARRRNRGRPNWCPTFMPSPAISPATPHLGPNWLYPSSTKARSSRS